MTIDGQSGPIRGGHRRRSSFVFIALVAMVAASTATVSAASPSPVASRLVSGLASGSGSTVGPDGALYVTEGATGKVLRVDPATGAVTTFASGLPQWVIGLGGAMDVAFLHGTAYVLVTLVSPDVGGSDADGIYRIDGPNQATLVADIGAFAEANPPKTDFFIPTGLQYAMEVQHGRFLVTDGHHNRVYSVSLDGTVSEYATFDDIVPTGLEVRGGRVYMSEAGPVPHEPQNGRIVRFKGTPPWKSAPKVSVVASGARLMVDVEYGRGHLYGLSQGIFPPGNPPGSPADHDTGSLVVNDHGTLKTVIGGLDQPTSLEFIGTTAYVVTLGGEIWRIDHAAS
jgi:hypothetical protein